MNTIKQFFRWLPVLLLCLCSFFVYFFLAGCRFLALVILGIAAAYCVYLALRIVQKHHKKLGSRLLMIFYILVAVGLIACIWAGILVGNAAQGNPDAACEYVIVLGAGVNGTTPSLSLQWRIDAAYEYLSAHPQVQCIVSGGQGPGEDISEAQCMYDRLTAMGIDSSRIWLEQQSTSTQENIAFSLEVIQQATGSRPDTVGILSSEYHLYRAGRFAAEQGLTAIGIPARTQWPHLFISYFVREIFAVMYYSIFG